MIKKMEKLFPKINVLEEIEDLEKELEGENIEIEDLEKELEELEEEKEEDIIDAKETEILNPKIMQVNRKSL